MGPKAERIAAKILWSLTVLITFILLFERYLELPAWVQSLGRMHPLVLHFPIVIVIMGLAAEFFFRSSKGSPYTPLLKTLWLVGALSAGLTVVMGIFLSQEEGYAGNTLFWHKWTGVGVFYLSALRYWLTSLPSYPKAEKIAVIAGGVFLLISGHLGAELTHGEGFISEPLKRTQERESVPFEQAIVFEHLVQPVLETRCTGCHNLEKAKGELILTDSLSILKGGKSGALFSVFEPETSLLIERIHLPEEDKKHMPPKGKPQLTPEEKAILSAWIRAGAPYSAKVSALSPQDSLSILARGILKPKEKKVDEYTFKAAAEEVIAGLNNEYRNVTPVALNSPGLSIELYGSQNYSPKLLEDLSAVKHQIVSLNVSRLPVKDPDLKIIADFTNLRRLNLNFTEVTGEGLAALQKLSNLETILLAGLKLDENSLQKFLSTAPKLRNATIWETGISGDKVAQLSKEFPNLSLLGDLGSADTTRLQLNKPLARSDSWVFSETSKIELYHPVRNVNLHYTTDGSTPDNSSPVASGPLSVDRSTVVKVRGYKEGWLPSDVAEFQMFQNTFKPDSVFLLTKLNRVHLAEGAHTFFDRQLGAIGANNPAWANHFAGVRNNNLELLCWFNTPIDLKTVGIRHMIEEETGIYPPGIIEIWGGENENQLRVIAKNISPELPEPKEKPSLRKIELPVKSGSYKCLKIVSKPFQRPNEGPKLILIDEMFLN